MKRSQVRLMIYGVNISKLYKILKKNDIEMLDIDRQDYKTIYFNVYSSKLKKLFVVLKNSCYTVKVIEYYGIRKFFEFGKSRFGYIIGSVIFIIALVLSNLFVSDIKIYGTNVVSPTEVVSLLKQNGIHCGSLLKNCDSDKISSLLSNKFNDISLVSILKKGTSIIINIKEKQSIEKLEDISKDIVASCDGEVLEISVMQGTPLVEVGDKFSAGDILVKGSFLSIDNQEISCYAQAEIKARLTLTATEKFYNQLEKDQLTGKTITNSYFSLFGLNFFKNEKKNTFESFETKTSESFIFNNNLVPLKLVTTKFYETKKVIVNQNFEDFKKSLQKSAKQKAAEMLDGEYEIVNQFEKIVETEYGFDVKYSIEIVKYL